MTAKEPVRAGAQSEEAGRGSHGEHWRVEPRGAQWCTPAEARSWERKGIVMEHRGRQAREAGVSDGKAFRPGGL